ncbi:MAG TPA: hypothetical protein VNA69_07070 [Thermoanaerobaculia bacterium]|nr:hypothetical protein [Thermoanaerobaculia bacterium]
MLTWHAHGRTFPPHGASLPSWIGGHGALPFAVPSTGRTARVFFSGRDEQNRAHVGACSMRLDDLSIAPGSITGEPLVVPGPAGTFDESGCSMSCIVQQDGRWFLYYTGWMLGRTVPFYLAIGLAVSDDGGQTFRKHSLAPILDRGDVDPLLTASPSVLHEDGCWRMWYVSAVKWEPHAKGPRHHYLIKYAESRDGISWQRDGRIAIAFDSPEEYAMGRPHVVHDGDRYRMWFCVRGDRYRIAYAESADGLGWRRIRHSSPAVEDWDAEMQAYPMVLPDGPRWLMLYNGNSYGATGFGCATAERVP